MAEDTPTPGGARPRPAGPARQPSGADTGWAVTGTLISGMAVWGGVGWLLDRWLDIVVFFPVGIIFGMAVAIYLVVKRYGAADPIPGRTATKTRGGRRSRPGTVTTRTQKGQR
jgi:F0F1-type ATP synthase assembly protein I